MASLPRTVLLSQLRARLRAQLIQKHIEKLRELTNMLRELQAKKALMEAKRLEHLVRMLRGRLKTELKHLRSIMKMATAAGELPARLHKELSSSLSELVKVVEKVPEVTDKEIEELLREIIEMTGESPERILRALARAVKA